MATRKTKFQQSWLSRKDATGNKVSTWAAQVEGDPYSTLCRICDSRYDTSKGFYKLDQHAKTTKHSDNLYKIDGSQTILVPNPDSSLAKSYLSKNMQSTLTSPDSPSIKLSVQGDAAATRIELYWAMEVVKCNYSLNSCQGKLELFKVMFPGSIPDSLALSPSKISRMITEALGPFFLNTLVQEVKCDDPCLTVQYDETSHSKHRKELQVRISFWSSSRKMIVNRHLVTYFIKRGNSDTILFYLIKAIDSHGLPMKNVIALGSDGPNVNKAVARKFNEHLKTLKLKSLIDIGTCFLHIVNNAFVKGLNSLPLDVNGFLNKLFFFYERSDKLFDMY
ncbi:hypothetical protein QAD02_019823 [Eretmocerus hayati]|uniref:Uncharacterized protein n=1 Tax=Eretmocerus hayati TaxID=131215 RepID=A0ACC2PLW1_9HYME|nr:hypothetical protein QAD02_019823 [Eretmocerus hayati]